MRRAVCQLFVCSFIGVKRLRILKYARVKCYACLIESITLTLTTLIEVPLKWFKMDTDTYKSNTLDDNSNKMNEFYSMLWTVSMPNSSAYLTFYCTHKRLIDFIDFTIYRFEFQWIMSTVNTFCNHVQLNTIINVLVRNKNRDALNIRSRRTCIFPTNECDHHINYGQI